MNIKKILGGMSAVALGVGVTVVTAFAATTYTPGGDAIIVAGGNPGKAAQIRSDAGITPSYGFVRVTPDTPIAWEDLDVLSTDFNVTDDSCGGGSPRIQIALDTNNDDLFDGNVHIAFGPSPSFAGCTTGWQSTGNLIGNADAGRYDYSAFGGSAFTTYSNAPASVLTGKVLRISVVVDGSWSAAATGGDSEQTVLVDNITLNSDVTTFDPVLVAPPTDKEMCKKGGWKIFNNPSFKNQGACVSFVESNDRAGKRLQTFAASESYYYNGLSVSDGLYATGPISFTWDSVTGVVTGGYWNEISPAYTGTTYYNIVESGTVSGTTVNLTFDRTLPTINHFTFEGTLVGGVLTGKMAGPYLFSATGL